MYRQLAAILLLLSFAAQVFNRNILVFTYYANKASFANACENKARPMMHCNGKCQLMKKLNEQDKKDQQNPERKGENKDEVADCQSFFATGIAALKNKTFGYTFLHALKPTDRPSFIFHPPLA